MSVWAIGAGLSLSLAGWLIPRRVARTRLIGLTPLLLDLMPPIVFFALFIAVTARPLFSGALTLALMGGFGFTDLVKREVLREPVVFSDIGEAMELFRHPRLYLPFAGPVRVIAVALLAFAAFAALLYFEPAVWPWSAWPAFLVPLAVVGVGLGAHDLVLDQSAGALRKLRPSGDPFQVAARLGPLTLQLTYTLIARQERQARRLEANRRAPFGIVRRSGALAPVIIVQCESFFDPRRLGPGIADGLVPRFDACRSTGVQWGRLTVPGWGANTMRAEFAVMTGLDEQAIGLDRFNPYFAFARAPLNSLARQMRDQGYRTLCLHPFDRTFYRRDQVMPCLGFDKFLGEEAFAGAARSGHYVADTEVARVALEILREEGPGTFLFAITMDNHGPWTPAPDTAPMPPASALASMPQPAFGELGGLRQYLAGVQRSDAMLGMIADSLSAAGSGLCAFYGDHLPSFPAIFDASGFTEISTDYVIWRAQAGAAARRDLAAHDLGKAIVDAFGAEP